jgi:protein-disulfide isomerase
VKFTYKYYPVVDFAAQRGVNESHWSAYAAECANVQGKFWEYHDKLFKEHRGEFVGTYTKPNLKRYAAEIGLDTGKFNTCIDNEETKPVIDASIAEVNRLGINGTPTFLVNGKILQVRSVDFSEFQRTFDSLLK